MIGEPLVSIYNVQYKWTSQNQRNIPVGKRLNNVTMAHGNSCFSTDWGPTTGHLLSFTD